MTSNSHFLPLPIARPPPADRTPARLELALGDGYRTAVYVHAPPPGRQRLPILYAHGIQSHPGWFMASAAMLAGCGHPVYQVTRRGSGENPADRGHARSAAQLLADVRTACRFILQQTGADRLHLLGASWGGKLLTAYALWPGRHGEPASLTLLAPGLVSRVDLPAVTKLAVALSAAVAPRRRFDIPLGEPELFTDNPAMRDYLRRDGLALHRATARFLLASRCLDRVLAKAPRGALRAPSTLVLAETDRIIDNAGTQALMERLTAGRCVVRHLAGCHVLEFQDDPSPLYAAMAESLDRAEAERAPAP